MSPESPRPHFSLLATSFAGGPRPRNAALILAGLWLLLFFASLFAPPLLDDADATHAQAARAMASTGDLVTLQVNGVRYLEKAPLPYWLAALSIRLFGSNTFAAHLPQALAVALLALLGHRWANQAFGSRTAFYTAIALLTSPGVFLFTRILIPEALLSLFLAAALFAFLKSLGPISSPTGHQPPPDSPRLPHLPPPVPGSPSSNARMPNLRVPKVGLGVRPTAPDHSAAATIPLPPSSQPHLDDWAQPQSPPPPERPALIPPVGPLYPYLMWSFLALAVLTKGLVALVFFLATTLLYLLLLGEFKPSLSKLKLLPGTLLFLLIAAPWHILAALRNPGGDLHGHHGFLWFYFINEHILRFLGRRTPADFNKLPGTLFWLQHLLWLFPWSLFLPLALTALVRRYTHQTRLLTASVPALKGWRAYLWSVALVFATLQLRAWLHLDFFTFMVLAAVIVYLAEVFRRRRRGHLTPSPFHRIDPQQRSLLLLALFAAITLLFFSLSTNQEYYTFPAYLPILLLLAATITRAEQTYSSNPSARRWIAFAHLAFIALGAAATLALLVGLWSSRHLPASADLSVLLAHRNIGSYTLATSRLFDLTTAAFADLRLPALLAILALAAGPTLAWLIRKQRRHLAATSSIAFTSALFLIAAHLAFARFAPLLSSQPLAACIRQLQVSRRIAPDTRILLLGDQSFGSSLPFYLGHPVQLVDGRSTSMLFGSTFADMQIDTRNPGPPIFLTPQELVAAWSHGPRHILFVPLERRQQALELLHPAIPLAESGGKLLLTDRPLDPK